MPVPNIGVEAFHIGLESFPGFRTFAAQTKKNGFPTMSVRPCEILNCGDVYLFPETNSRCQGRSSLWSVIVLRKRNVVLESDTGIIGILRCGGPLPSVAVIADWRNAPNFGIIG